MESLVFVAADWILQWMSHSAKGSVWDRISEILWDLKSGHSPNQAKNRSFPVGIYSLNRERLSASLCRERWFAPSLCRSSLVSNWLVHVHVVVETVMCYKSRPTWIVRQVDSVGNWRDRPDYHYKIQGYCPLPDVSKKLPC